MARLGIDVQDRLPAALPGTSQRCDVGPPLPAHREVVALQLQQAAKSRPISDPYQRRRDSGVDGNLQNVLVQWFGSGQQPRFPPALELDQSREILGGRPRLAQVLLLDQRQRPFDEGPIGRFRPRRDQHIQAVFAIHGQRRGAVKGMLPAVVFVMRDRRGQPAVCLEDAQPVMPTVRHDQMLAVVDQSARLGKASQRSLLVDRGARLRLALPNKRPASLLSGQIAIVAHFLMADFKVVSVLPGRPAALTGRDIQHPVSIEAEVGVVQCMKGQVVLQIRHRSWVQAVLSNGSFRPAWYALVQPRGGRLPSGRIRHKIPL